MKVMFFRGLFLVFVTGIGVSAARFEMKVEPLTFDQSRNTPGGYGGFGQFMTQKPSGLMSPSDLKSEKPLYGQVYTAGAGNTAQQFVMVLDEPKGTGKGYDRLYVDLDGDQRFGESERFEESTGEDAGLPPSYEQATFGPITLPQSKAVGIWRPAFYVEVYLYNKEMLQAQAASGVQFPIGQLRLLAANYLATTVQLEGIEQRLGLIDGNCNFHLPDGAESHSVRRSMEGAETWMLSAGDWILRDRNGNGQFERGSVSSDAEMFSSIVYFGSKPYSLQVGPELSWIELEPYTGTLGRLEVQPQIRELVLGWSAEGNQDYQALTPAISDGTALVPLGNLRVSSCTIGGKGADGSLVMAQSREVPDTVRPVGADQPTPLDLGQPLTLTATAETRRGTASSEGVGFRAAVSRMFGGGSSSSRAPDIVVINTEVKGAGGERYSSFITENTQSLIPPPTFEVLDAAGTVVASGNLEYG